MNKRKIVIIGGLLIMAAVILGIRVKVNHRPLVPTMTASEIAAYRETHPEFDTMSSWEHGGDVYMEIQSTLYDFVICRYEKGVFWYETTVVEASEWDNDVESFVTEEGKIQANWNPYMSEWRLDLIQGQRYLFPVFQEDGAEYLEAQHAYLYYVTEENCVVNASTALGETGTALNGMSLGDFARSIVRMQENLSVEHQRILENWLERLSD